MSRQSLLRGISAPLLTPHHSDGSVNYEEYTRLTGFVANAGVHGIFVCGTTGEFINLTLEERKRLLTAATKGAAADTRIMFNVTAMNLEDMKMLFDWAKSEGAHAASVTAPYYHRYDADTLAAYFQQASQLSGDLPLYLYNIPGMALNQITPGILERVCRSCPNVKGLKDSSMDFQLFQEFQCLELPEGFELMTGNDAQVLPVLQADGAGAVVALAGVYPQLCRSVWDCYYAGDLEGARQAQKKVLKLRDLVRRIMPIMAHKKMLEKQGFDMGPARFPFRALTEAECKAVEEGVSAILG